MLTEQIWRLIKVNDPKVPCFAHLPLEGKCETDPALHFRFHPGWDLHRLPRRGRTAAEVRPGIKVLLVYDRTPSRRDLARALEMQSKFQLVGQASTVTDGLQMIDDLNPDVILLDLHTPGPWAYELLEGLNGTRKVLLLTAVSDIGEIARLLQAGACGVACNPQQVTQAITKIKSGELWVNEFYLREFIVALARDPREAEYFFVSTREHQILGEVRKGLINKEIAEHLRISEAGVKAGLQRLFRKYGVSNRVQLVATSGRNGNQ